MKFSDVGEWLLFRHAPPDVLRRGRRFRLVGVNPRGTLAAAVAFERQSLYRRLPPVAAAEIGAGEIGMASAPGAFGTDEQPVFRTLTEVADLPAHARDKNESGTCVKGVAGGVRDVVSPREIGFVPEIAERGFCMTQINEPGTQGATVRLKMDGKTVEVKSSGCLWADLGKLRHLAESDDHKEGVKPQRTAVHRSS